MNHLATQLADQLDWHWQASLRPRLDGLTDAEYYWSPVPDCWSVHPDGGIDFAYPEPQPAPFTTLSWRLAHVIVGVLAMRAHNHFGGPAASYETWDYATNAADALAQLDDAYRLWHDGVTRLDDAALTKPIGPAEGPWADRSMSELILHINREVIHHGAEIALLRDLYTHTNRNTELKEN